MIHGLTPNNKIKRTQKVAPLIIAFILVPKKALESPFYLVRAGAVKHPKEWPFCGYYNEIQKPRQRYAIICSPTFPIQFQPLSPRNIHI